MNTFTLDEEYYFYDFKSYVLTSIIYIHNLSIKIVDLIII